MTQSCMLQNSLVRPLHKAMISAGKTLALAESCTGGAIAAHLVSEPGASDFFLGSIVVYADAWKEHFLKVRHETLAKYGAVSREVVAEMAQGVLEQTKADYALAVSGLLGPNPVLSTKPLGTVFLAIQERGKQVKIEEIQALGDRKEAIEIVVREALNRLCKIMNS